MITPIGRKSPRLPPREAGFLAARGSQGRERPVNDPGQRVIFGGVRRRIGLDQGIGSPYGRSVSAGTFNKQGRGNAAGHGELRRIRVGTTQLASVPEPKYQHLKTVIGEALDSDFAVGEILPTSASSRHASASPVPRSARPWSSWSWKAVCSAVAASAPRSPRRASASTSPPPSTPGRVSATRPGSPRTSPPTWPRPPSPASWRPAPASGCTSSAASASARASPWPPSCCTCPPAPSLVSAPSTRPPDRHVPARCCASSSTSPWTARTAPWSSVRPAPTTPRSSTGCRARPCSS